jgi:transposase
MDQRELFTVALGLGKDWEVSSFDFKPERQEIHINVRHIRSAVLPSCRTCGKAGIHIHDYRPHTWRHLDFWQHKTYIHAEVPRVMCDDGHATVIDVPWARKGSGYTLLLEGMVLELAKGMPIAQVSRIVRLSDKKLWRIVDWYVNRAVEDQDLKSLKRIGIDETSRRRRHQYITVFMDLDTRRVVFVSKGKGVATIREFTAFLRRRGIDPSQVTDVSCDMSESFISGTTKYLPSARITLDRFHIVKLIGSAVDSVRRRERYDQPCLKGARYALLKRPERLTGDERTLVHELTQRNIETAKAYHLRLIFDDFFRQQTTEQGRGFLKGWVAAAVASGIEEMQTAAGTIRRHWKMVVNWTRTRITNGLLEGFNSLLQAMKSCARGYRSFEYIRTIAYLIGIKPRVHSHLG